MTDEDKVKDLVTRYIRTTMDVRRAKEALALMDIDIHYTLQPGVAYVGVDHSMTYSNKGGGVKVRVTPVHYTREDD